MSSNISPLPPHQAWPREYLLTILQAALRVQEFRFARQTALHWLASYPGDLPVDLIYGQALWGEGHLEQAQKTAQKLCDRDPEYLAAQKLLALCLAKTGSERDSSHQGDILALEGQPSEVKVTAKRVPKTPRWAIHLREARKALEAKNFERAESQAQEALALEADTPLAALTHLRILACQPDTPNQALQNLATHFQQRWPECVQFILLRADSLMDGGDPGQAVALLHRATAYDVTGQVAQRLWGDNHAYRDLWPTKLSAVIDTPIPARLTAVLGWNLLDVPTPLIPIEDRFEIRAGDSARVIDKTNLDGNLPINPANFSANLETPNPYPEASEPGKDPPETLRSIQAELENVSDHLKHPALARLDGRFPIYVVLSTKRGLRAKYGRAGTAMLEAAMQELAESVRQGSGWGAMVFLVDDPGYTTQYEVKPAPAEDPWAIKLAITDLDAALGKKGMMVGAVLIVGGPQVVPFHTLPNPTDDPDVEVPSDNPYATRDENYFIPEWPVGRLPGGAGSNPALLLSAIQAITADHTARRTPSHSWWHRLQGWFLGLFQPNRKAEAGSFGFSAEAWRKASLAVYQSIGNPGGLVTSPPINAEAQEIPMLRGQLGYFNLHGLADTGEWYGQRDVSLPNGSRGPDYPVALRVQDIRNGGSAPEIIFSEACYGAHIINKQIDDSLALKFLTSGSRVLVGSTVMSYGSISAPLNAADLLGVSFWKFLKDGSPAGEALQRAKIHLAREMHKRQGYLDGEDQKTLISFVLYGDPLAQPAALSLGKKSGRHKRSKTAIRTLNPPSQVKTVCDRSETPGSSEPISEELMTNVKQVVAQYLPGMQGARVTLTHEHVDCNCEGHCCPTAQLGAKARPDVPVERRVVTLSKSIPLQRHTHPAYARLTLDKNGKVVKLAVSR